MDDSEYYAKMRKQYSNPIKIPKSKNKQTENTSGLKTPGTFSSWEKKYGHEDAEMFMERNDDTSEGQE